ncbi:MAG TPA: hypothetical protein VFA66_03820 [Gaiellaceae bacterium]|nr:hypothetical protein [Gaiellaceae bacterium]
MMVHPEIGRELGRQRQAMLVAQAQDRRLPLLDWMKRLIGTGHRAAERALRERQARSAAEELTHVRTRVGSEGSIHVPEIENAR